MIEQEDIFDEVKDNLGLWCETDCSGADLAAAAGAAITNKLRAVAVAPSGIAPLWAWLENTNIKIFGRFYVVKIVFRYQITILQRRKKRFGGIVDDIGKSQRYIVVQTVTLPLKSSSLC